MLNIIKKFLPGPGTGTLILAVISLLFYQEIMANKLSIEIEQQKTTIAFKDKSINDLTVTARKLEETNSEQFKQLTSLGKLIEKANTNSKVVYDKLKSIEEDQKEKTRELAKFSNARLIGTINSKPDWMRKKIVAASKRAYSELSESTKINNGE